MGIKIGQAEQSKEGNSGFLPFELKIPKDLFQAYRLDIKVKGRVPKGALLHVRCISLFHTYEWFQKYWQDACLELKGEVEEQ